jgi:CRISPR-associated protein Csm3
MQLKAKIFIKGTIITKTGLHIGGSKSSLDIGGVDLNVVKSPQGVPFIPGSSLKGKLRSLLAKLHGSVAVKKGDEDKLADEDFPYIMHLFGRSGDDRSDGAEAKVTRLLVRDAPLDTDHFEKEFEDKGAELELGYTDIKWENRIDRKRGTALDPRQLERVPAGAEFKFELVYDLYDDAEVELVDFKKEEPNWNIAKPSGWDDKPTLLDMHIWAIRTAMQLLQDDYLGGQGSRGYGQIEFKVTDVVQKEINDKGYAPSETLHETIEKYNLKESFTQNHRKRII